MANKTKARGKKSRAKSSNKRDPDELADEKLDRVTGGAAKKADGVIFRPTADKREAGGEQ